MMYFIKLVGAALLLVGAICVSREYEKHAIKGSEICRGFVDLLSHIRRKIDGYLTPITTILDGFDCPALEEVGFLRKARDIGISAAYFELSNELPLEKEAKDLLYSFFCDFGKDYKEETVRTLDFALQKLREHQLLLLSENSKKLKLVRTISLAIALGIIILLI